MKKTLLVVTLLLVTGCAAPSPEPPPAIEPAPTVEPPPTIAPSPTPPALAARPEDIVGEWRTRDGFFIEFFQDGTHAGGTEIPGTIGPDAPINGRFWFEGTMFFIEDIRHDFYLDEVGELCHAIGSYEIYLMENGDLLLNLFEDECYKRREQIEWVISPVE